MMLIMKETCMSLSCTYFESAECYAEEHCSFKFTQ